MKIEQYKKIERFIIAELMTHDGSYGILQSMIEAIAKTVDAVKFQIHVADAESSTLEPFRVKFLMLAENMIIRR